MLSLPKACVQFLVRELGSHKLCGTAKKEESKFWVFFESEWNTPQDQKKVH